MEKKYSNLYYQNWRKNNPEKSHDITMRWRQKNPEKYKIYLRNYFRINKLTIYEKRMARRTPEDAEKDRIRSAKKRSVTNVTKIYNMILGFNKTILKG